MVLGKDLIQRFLKRESALLRDVRSELNLLQEKNVDLTLSI
jgi:hypothetical protein